MYKMTRPVCLIMLSLSLVSCGSLFGPSADGDFVTTPRGYFKITDLGYGPVTQAHLEAADRYWQEVNACMGKPSNVVRNVRMYLRRYAFTCGDYPGSFGCFNRKDIRIDVLGDYETYKYAWKGEMVHLALFVHTGNYDKDHLTPFFNKCMWN